MSFHEENKQEKYYDFDYLADDESDDISIDSEDDSSDDSGSSGDPPPIPSVLTETKKKAVPAIRPPTKKDTAPKVAEVAVEAAKAGIISGEIKVAEYYATESCPVQ